MFELASHHIITTSTGEGAFGKVRLVKAKTTGKYYAMKMTRKERIIKMEVPNDVLNEYKVLKDLSHPNILTVSSTFFQRHFNRS